MCEWADGQMQNGTRTMINNGSHDSFRAAILLMAVGLIIQGTPSRARADGVSCSSLMPPAKTWAAENIEQLSSQRILLLDTSGSIRDNVTAHGKRIDQGLRYFNSVVEERLPKWLRARSQLHFWERGGQDVVLLGYGLRSGESWRRDFFHMAARISAPDSYRALSAYGAPMLANKSGLSKFGVASATAPMLVRLLADCRTSSRAAAPAPISALHILNISDNESNGDHSAGLNEVQTVTRVSAEENLRDGEYLWMTIATVNKYYNYTSNQYMSVFFENADTFEDDTAKMFSSDYRARRALAATLTTITPAIPLVMSDHVALAEAIQFSFDAEGFRGRVALERVAATSPYDLMRLCATVLRPSGESYHEECRGAEEAGRPLSFHIAEQDVEGPRATWPDRVRITAMFRYHPSDIDIGLAAQGTQEYRVLFQDPPVYTDGTAMTRQDLRTARQTTPSLTADDLRDQRNAELALRAEIAKHDADMKAQAERAELAMAAERKQWLMFGVGIALVTLIGGVALRVLHRFRSRYPRPNIQFCVGNGGLEGETLSTEPTDLPAPALDLNQYERMGDTIIGYLHLRNDAKPNGYGRPERIWIDEIGVEQVAAVPTTLGNPPTAPASLRLALQAEHRDLPLAGHLTWPIILDLASMLPAIRESDFPKGEWNIHGRVRVRLRRESGDALEPMVRDFSSGSTVQPRQYSFTPKLSLANDA